MTNRPSTLVDDVVHRWQHTEGVNPARCGATIPSDAPEWDIRMGLPVQFCDGCWDPAPKSTDPVKRLHLTDAKRLG